MMMRTLLWLALALAAGLSHAQAQARFSFAIVGDAPVMTAKIVTCTAPGAFRTVELFETLLAPLVNCEQPSRFRF